MWTHRSTFLPCSISILLVPMSVLHKHETFECHCHSRRYGDVCLLTSTSFDFWWKVVVIGDYTTSSKVYITTKWEWTTEFNHIWQYGIISKLMLINVLIFLNKWSHLAWFSSSDEVTSTCSHRLGILLDLTFEGCKACLHCSMSYGSFQNKIMINNC